MDNRRRMNPVTHPEVRPRPPSPQMFSNGAATWNGISFYDQTWILRLNPGTQSRLYLIPISIQLGYQVGNIVHLIFTDKIK